MLVLATLAVLAALSGCESPEVKRQMAERQRSLAWTAKTLVDHERTAAQNLRHSVEFIGDDTAWHARATERDLRALKAYLEFDIRRFQERQKDYRDKLLEILGGKPEEIGPAAVIMFL